MAKISRLVRQSIISIRETVTGLMMADATLASAQARPMARPVFSVNQLVSTVEMNTMLVKAMPKPISQPPIHHHTTLLLKDSTATTMDCSAANPAMPMGGILGSQFPTKGRPQAMPMYTRVEYREMLE